MDQSDELIGATEAAKVLGIDPVRLREWLKQGRIRAVQVGSGGRYQLRRADVLAYVDDNRAAERRKTGKGKRTTPAPRSRLERHW